MPRPRPPHLHRQVTRHGKTVWYVRFGKGPRVRIRAEFGTPEFGAEYQAAITARHAHGRLRARLLAPSSGSLPDITKPPHGRRSLGQRGGSVKTSSCMSSTQ